MSNLLHTNSDYFYQKNLLSQLDGNKKDSLETGIEQEIKKLEEKEKAFYSEMLGHQVKDFNSFLEEIREKTKDVQSAFKKLSSFDKVEGLYQSFLKNIDISTENATTETGKKDIALLQEHGYLNGTSARDLSQNIEIDMSLDGLKNISITFNKKKKKTGKSTVKKEIPLKKIIDELSGNAETITLQFFEEKVVPALEKLFDSDESLKNYNVSIPQLIGALKKSIAPLIKTTIANEPELHKSITEAIYSQGAMYTTQRAALYKRKAISNKKESERIKNLILDYLVKEVDDVDKFTRAFNKAWNIKDANSNEIVDAITMNGSSNFIGAMGELGGLTLLFYVNDNPGSIQWTGSEINRYGEQKRQDIMLDAFGIQVKNYKESTLNFPSTVRLHPTELFQQLAMRGFNQSEPLKDILANMAFNKDIAENEVYINGIKEILTHYLGALLNFNSGNLNLDSNNIWLVGGNMLIPGSEILRAYFQSLSESKIADIKITTSYKGKTDEEYRMKKEGSDSPEFTSYWKKRKNNVWYSTGKTESTYNNLISTDAISIKTSFIFSKIFKDIKQYRFLL